VLFFPAENAFLSHQNFLTGKGEKQSKHFDSIFEKKFILFVFRFLYLETDLVLIKK